RRRPFGSGASRQLATAGRCGSQSGAPPHTPATLRRVWGAGILGAGVWVVEMVVGRGAAPSSDGTRRAPHRPPAIQDAYGAAQARSGKPDPGRPTNGAVGLRLPPNEGTTPLSPDPCRRPHGGRGAGYGAAHGDQHGGTAGIRTTRRGRGARAALVRGQRPVAS